MSSPKSLQDELRFVTDFHELLDVIQQVAVLQLRHCDEEAVRRVDLAQVLMETFLSLVPVTAMDELSVRGGEHGQAIVVFASEEGFVGPLLSETMRQALKHADASTQWWLVGQRGLRLLDLPDDRLRVLPMPAEEEAREVLRRLAQDVLAHCLQAKLHRAWLIAPRFRSVTQQDVVVQQLFPLPVTPHDPNLGRGEVVIEPSVSRVVEHLITSWMEHRMIDTFWSARHAEYAARILQVEVSRQELAKRTKLLRYAWFKLMHERVNVLVQETGVVQRCAMRRR